MSVKSTVFVLWCVGTCFSHPAYQNNHAEPEIPLQFPDNLVMDQMNAQIAQNFDHSSMSTSSKINQREIPDMEKTSRQFSHDYPPQSYSFHDSQIPLSVFGKPSQLPDDVELINAPVKPVPFKPNFQDVELIWPSSGKPINFPRDREMTESISGMQREQSQMPLMVAREGSQMMPIMVDTMQPHMMPMMVEKQGLSMPMMMEQERAMMPSAMHQKQMMSIERDGAHMMPLAMHQGPEMMSIQREGAHMMPSAMHQGLQMMSIEREGTHMMPMMMHRENSQLMPVMIERERPQIMQHEQTDRFKRHEPLTTPISVQRRNEIERDFLSELDKTLDNVEKQNIISYPVEIREQMAFVPVIQNDQINQQSMSDFDLQNEVKHKDLEIMDKIMNDEEGQSTSAPSTTTMSLFDTINEIKHQKLNETDKIMNDEQDENTSSNINHQQTTAISLFDTINEIKHQPLSETDKLMNDQPPQAASTATKDDQNQSTPPMSLFDSQNQIKNKELAAIDKLPSNDQPQTEEPINTITPEKTTISIFESQNEVKNQNLAANDKIQNDQIIQIPSLPINPIIFEKTTPTNVIAAEMEFNREIALIDRLLKNDLAAINKILNDPTLPPSINRDIAQKIQNQAKSQRLTENIQNDEADKTGLQSTNDQMTDKTPMSTSDHENHDVAQKDMPYREFIQHTTLPTDLLVTQIIQEIRYDIIDQPSANSNQTNSLESKSKEVNDKASPTQLPTQPVKTPDSLNLVELQALTRILSNINQEFSTVRSDLQHSPQNMMAYPQHYNNMENYAAVQPMVITSAENAQQQYKYMYPNYHTGFYQ